MNGLMQDCNGVTAVLHKAILMNYLATFVFSRKFEQVDIFYNIMCDLMTHFNGEFMIFVFFEILRNRYASNLL